MLLEIHFFGFMLCQKYSNFSSASLPRNAPHVVALEVSGMIAPNYHQFRG